MTPPKDFLNEINKLKRNYIKPDLVEVIENESWRLTKGTTYQFQIHNDTWSFDWMDSGRADDPGSTYSEIQNLIQLESFASQLRLGNLLLRHFENEEGELEITTSRTIFECQTKGMFTFSGIQLTSDVLEQLEVKYDSTEDWYTLENNIILTQNLNDKQKYTIFKLHDGDTLITLCEVNYLHQLQNAIFVLTQQELNVQKYKESAIEG